MFWRISMGTTAAISWSRLNLSASPRFWALAIAGYDRSISHHVVYLYPRFHRPDLLQDTRAWSVWSAPKLIIFRSAKCGQLIVVLIRTVCSSTQQHSGQTMTHAASVIQPQPPFIVLSWLINSVEIQIQSKQLTSNYEMSRAHCRAKVLDHQIFLNIVVVISLKPINVHMWVVHDSFDRA